MFKRKIYFIIPVLFLITLVLGINTASVTTTPEVVVGFDFSSSTKRALITDDATFKSKPYTADTGHINNKNKSIIGITGGNKFLAWVNGFGGDSDAPNVNN